MSDLSHPLDATKFGAAFVHSGDTVRRSAEWIERVNSRIALQPHHEEWAALATVHKEPHGGFGFITGWTHTIYLYTGRVVTCSWGETQESYKVQGFTKAPGETPREWIIHFTEMGPASRFWPRVPTLAHAIAWVEQRHEIHAGECSPLSEFWFAATYPWAWNPQAHRPIA